MNSNNFMTCYIHRTILANPCQIWRQVLEIERKHMSKDKKKMHNWCLCCCLLLLGATTWNLTTLGFHLVFAFKATHSKFIQLTFHFYRCFYKSRHVKKFLVKRVSKGQRATTNMKSVRVFFEHCCCMAFFFKRFISASSLQTRMELQKKIF